MSEITSAVDVLPMQTVGAQVQMKNSKIVATNVVNQLVLMTRQQQRVQLFVNDDANVRLDTSDLLMANVSETVSVQQEMHVKKMNTGITVVAHAVNPPVIILTAEELELNYLSLQHLYAVQSVNQDVNV
jgi:hypothetical protein